MPGPRDTPAWRDATVKGISMTGNYRIYRYTSIGRSLDPAAPTNKAVLVLLPIAAVLGAALAWAADGTLIEVLLLFRRHSWAFSLSLRRACGFHNKSNPLPIL